VIHRPEVWIFVLFSLLDEQHGEPCCCRRFVCLFFLRWCLVCISPARSNRSRGNRPSSISVHTQKPPAAKGFVFSHTRVSRVDDDGVRDAFRVRQCLRHCVARAARSGALNPSDDWIAVGFAAEFVSGTRAHLRPSS